MFMTIVIITEKPDASRRIAEALAENKSLKVYTDENKVTYYEFERKGKKHVVVCAVGHLFNLSPKNKGNGWVYPIFDCEWKPSFEVRKDAEFSKKYFNVVASMTRNSSEFIVATDYDLEGSVIGYNILRFLAGVKDGRRMKFSTLTKEELIESYQTMQPHLDFQQIEAGLTRHELDWLWGINLTRALTLALKNYQGKGFSILSTGRVQGPTLAMLLEREIEIRKFKPTPFWEIQVHVKVDNKEFVAAYKKGKVWKKEEADKVVSGCKGKKAVIENITKKKYKQVPPVPFNTTDLQSEAYAQFKFSPTQTLSIAESLYQAGIISYPRSASQKLPPSIGYEKILKAMSSVKTYAPFAEELLKSGKLVPKEGPKDDPAHPCFPPDARFSLNPNGSMSFEDLSNLVIEWKWDEEKKSYFGRLSKPVKVLAFDCENNSIATSEIVGCWKTPYNKNLIKIVTTSNESIELTGNHPIMVLDAEGIHFKEASKLKKHDIILSRQYDNIAEDRILAKESFSPLVPPGLTFQEVKEITTGRKVDFVFDLEIAKYHTFFVSGFLVHNCVYPTHEVPDLKKLTPQQKKLYDLIVRRFLAVFGKDATRESNTVILDVNGHKFVIVGKRTIEPGWTKYYEPYLAREEIILPELKVGEVLEITKVEQLAKETQPPARYSQGSIIKELEKRNLGTKATRAEILQTLYDRRYIIGKSIQVTKLGEAVTKALKEYSPKILSEDLTRKFEKEMDEVYNGKKKREEVVEEAKETLKEILEEFKANEKKIGKKLLEGLQEARKEERRIGVCPNCGSELRIIRSKRTGLFFVGCSGYPKCKTAYPLPHNARIQATGKVCEKCGTPIVQVFRKGKRPFRMCLDPKCETKKDWNKKKAQKSKQE